MKNIRKARRIVKAGNIITNVILAPVNLFCFLITPLVWVCGFAYGFVESVVEGAR